MAGDYTDVDRGRAVIAGMVRRRSRRPRAARCGSCVSLRLPTALPSRPCVPFLRVGPPMPAYPWASWSLQRCCSPSPPPSSFRPSERSERTEESPGRERQSHPPPTGCSWARRGPVRPGGRRLLSQPGGVAPLRPEVPRLRPIRAFARDAVPPGPAELAGVTALGLHPRGAPPGPCSATFARRTSRAKLPALGPCEAPLGIALASCRSVTSPAAGPGSLGALRWPWVWFLSTAVVSSPGGEGCSWVVFDRMLRGAAGARLRHCPGKLGMSKSCCGVR